MREMDILCTQFVDTAYDGMSHEERSHLERLLECPDQDLLAWITGGDDPCDPALASLVARMRQLRPAR
jgi:succinate dehydrogenase flavin-adding protein (antitoxin of CptAB toxin-antitoxin module)